LYELIKIAFRGKRIYVLAKAQRTQSYFAGIWSGFSRELLARLLFAVKAAPTNNKSFAFFAPWREHSTLTPTTR
jgi:hypothetical protein